MPSIPFTNGVLPELGMIETPEPLLLAYACRYYLQHACIDDGKAQPDLHALQYTCRCLNLKPASPYVYKSDISKQLYAGQQRFRFKAQVLNADSCLPTHYWIADSDYPACILCQECRMPARLHAHTQVKTAVRSIFRASVKHLVLCKQYSCSCSMRTFRRALQSS
jgi:hypothetical protein